MVDELSKKRTESAHMTASLNLSLSGPLDQLRLVWQAGEALLETVSFDEDPEGTRYNVLVSVQEMVTNVFRHGYRDMDGSIEVRFALDPDRFSVEIRDQAPPFDPTSFAMNEVVSEEPPTQVGGYGIMIVRSVMDEVAYEHVDGQNRLCLTKFVKAPAMAGS